MKRRIKLQLQCDNDLQTIHVCRIRVSSSTRPVEIAEIQHTSFSKSIDPHNVSPSSVSQPPPLPYPSAFSGPKPAIASSLLIHHTNNLSRDLVMCRKQSGIAIGRLCDKCDGKCPVCDSYVRPTTLVRICDECSFGNYQNKCVVCGGEVRLLLIFWFV